MITSENDKQPGVGGSTASPLGSSEPSNPPDAAAVPAQIDDKFRKGRIIKYFPQSGYGFVRDNNGKEVYFHLDELRFVGTKNDRRYVNEGAPVGFDVGRTSRGLRVTKLKLY